MFHFECDWCNKRFFNSDLWYCTHCAILLCETCITDDKAGAWTHDVGEAYMHCQSPMDALKGNECQLTEVLLEKNPEMKDRMMLIFKRNKRVANEILKRAKHEGWSYEQLPPQVTQIYGHNLKWMRYELKKSWGNEPEFFQ